MVNFLLLYRIVRMTKLISYPITITAGPKIFDEPFNATYNHLLVTCLLCGAVCVESSKTTSTSIFLHQKWHELKGEI
jgi:hypothetical protein